MFRDRREAQPGGPTAPASSPHPGATTAPTFLNSITTLRPSLGADASVNGRLSFTRPTRLDGTLRGEVHSSDVLVIGETGLVNGVVRAQTLVILGRVHGDVVETNQVEVRRGGILHGDVEARALLVHEGGYFLGRCRIAPPTRATVHALRPRSACEEGKVDQA